MSSNGQDIIHKSIVLRKGVLEKTKDLVNLNKKTNPDQEIYLDIE